MENRPFSGYNNAGELQSADYSDATPDVAYTYDRLGRQKTIVQGTNTTTCTYNLAGELLSESYTGGTLAGLSVTNGYAFDRVRPLKRMFFFLVH